MSDADWLKARLQGSWGEKGQIAAALGVKNQTVSKILVGLRRLKPEEKERLRALLGVPPPTAEEHAFLEALRDVPKDRHPEVLRFLRFIALEASEQPPLSLRR